MNFSFWVRFDVVLLFFVVYPALHLVSGLLLGWPHRDMVCGSLVRGWKMGLDGGTTYFVPFR